MRRSAVAVVAALVLLAACSSDGSSKASPTTTTRVPDATAYVDAIAAGLLAGTPASARAILRADVQCVARAIVDGIGVARFRAANVTIAQLRDADFVPPKAVAGAMTPAARTTLGTNLQTCGVGRVVGSQVSLDFAGAEDGAARADPGEVACFARGFGGEVARPMIAGMVLHDLSVASADRLAKVTIGCVGLTRIFENASGVKLSGVETQCVDRAARTEGSDASLVRLLADSFRGVESRARTAATRFGVQVVACLTPAHVAAITGR